MSLIEYSQTVNLRTNDFDTYDRIKPQALLDLFQDVAGLHATKIGIGFKASYDMGYFWVLIRNKIEILKNPEPLTDATLVTWPHEKGRVDCDREYALYDNKGDLIARGISKWVIISTETRRIARTDKISYGEGELPSTNYFESQPKVTTPDGDYKLVLTHRVTLNDIDHNKHMNNAKYAELIFNTVDIKNQIKDMSIEYIHELKYDEVIDIYMLEDENYIYHYGMSNDNKIFSSVIKKG